MKLIRFLLMIATTFFIVSCGTQKKTPYYLENVIDTSGKETVKIPELRIQKNDLLSIQVYSLSTRPDVSDALYNLPCNNAQAGTSGASVCGFLVDANGNIEYPRLGTIHAGGLTKQELAAVVKKKLTQPVELLKDPSIIIRFLNYKVTVLGNVVREGVIAVPGEKITILEAVGQAGGITDFGKKNTVKVIREIDGKREIGVIDLTSKTLFDSPYYNLLQNDVVMVEPTVQKAKMNDQALVTQRIGLAISIISSAAVIYSIINR